MTRTTTADRSTALSDSLRHQSRAYFESLQNTICAELERIDGKATFIEDRWTHAEEGGGRTRFMSGGGVFEKAGVNFSAVGSRLPEPLANRLNVPPQTIFATGISLVLHPRSPMIPAVHMNLRYLEPANGGAWFGGGMDLTPFYLFEEDARHFHRVLRESCDKHEKSMYPRFKKWCDEYFFIKHRAEERGVGGIFFDYLRDNPQATFAFVREIGESFLTAYVPIVLRRRDEPWGEKQKQWQLIRRGRYVEFNLVYDRGTVFGLETRGRTESILMSLPPEVRWEYDHHPDAGSREAFLLDVLQHPRDWA